MSDHLSIQAIIDRLIDGTIRVPGFQRKFVWPPQRSALLMDSIYKQFPVGSILLWRTAERLTRENHLGSFILPPPDKDYPVDYVLDGQQRIMAILTAFQRTLVPADTDPDTWLPIYYDFGAVDDVQDSRFVALTDDQILADRHFPLSTFLEPVEFSLLTRELDEAKYREIARVQQRFLPS
ncbi:GmrSD restriction endonuclease domain-containing protein [Microbispora sp. CA-102843]|uniref:GmrSD restriction endonuclease domain-containing protein n=1 Tax=Microbispora sp. CA-102843 TaxID=3239952 RepID=UPI003D944045